MTESQLLSEKIKQFPADKNKQLIELLQRLANTAGLAPALRALFRQQVMVGYVLFDPLMPKLLTEKTFPALPGQAKLRLQWNPQRELRLNHELLLKRGVIDDCIDPDKLINRNPSGLACYLCPHNIALQSPREACFPITLNAEPHILGANFAPITDNHFTVITQSHRPQHYHRGVLLAGFDLVDATKGAFRVLFNGRAGASILEHEHMHASDIQLPIELLEATAATTLRQSEGVTVSQPEYPLPFWLIEGDTSAGVIEAGHHLIQAWKKLDPQRHSENLLMTLRHGSYRLFVIPRDLSKLTSPGRTSAMGSFEASGLIVLSQPSEQLLFDHLDNAGVEGLLASIAPQHSLQEAFSLARL